MSKKGFVLILSFFAIAVLTILGIAISSRSISERSLTQRFLESTQAFWLAEAGISQVLVEMEANNWRPVDIELTTLGSGEYSVEKKNASIVWAHGFIPSQVSPRAERIIELSMPYYGSALFVVGDIDITGDAYSIDGNVIYAGKTNPSIIPKPDNITGTVTYDPSIEQLDQLKFDQLRALSQSQGNYHDADHLDGPFPESFWYIPPENGNPGVPNIVFLEGSLELKGNDSIAGFFVVGGEAICDTTIAGNVSIDGCIYTQGDFIVKGGGGAMNVTGGIWVAKNATLKGGITLEYNADYVSGVQDLGMRKTKPKILWREAQNPYPLTP